MSSHCDASEETVVGPAPLILDDGSSSPATVVASSRPLMKDPAVALEIRDLKRQLRESEAKRYDLYSRLTKKDAAITVMQEELDDERTSLAGCVAFILDLLKKLLKESSQQEAMQSEIAALKRELAENDLYFA